MHELLLKPGSHQRNSGNASDSLASFEDSEILFRAVGKTYLFECSKCGYRAMAAGGATEGADLRVQTIICRDCRVVFDCVLALRREASTNLLNQLALLPDELAPTVHSALLRLPSPPGHASEWHEFAPACPQDPTHHVQLWTSPGRCPKCKNYLDRGALPYRQWD